MICKIMVYCVYMRHTPFVLVVVSLSLLAGFVFVHYPKTSTSTPVPFVIEHPEVFQAFYGELVGQPAYFTFDSAKDFSLYAGLLVLEANQQDADVSLQVYRIEEDVPKNIARIEAQEERFTVVPLFTLDGLSHNWEMVYTTEDEEHFLQGPELFGVGKTDVGRKKGIDAAPGRYIFRVHSRDNIGPYVLVVGDKESVSQVERIQKESSTTTPQIQKGGGTRVLFVVLVGATLLVLFCVWALEVLVFRHKRAVLLKKKKRKKPLRKKRK